LASFVNERAKKLYAGQKNILGDIEQKIKSGDQYVWFHAASLGEFEQGRPVIERLKAEKPEIKIIVTFFSPSGYEIRKNYAGADIVSYLPFDSRKHAKKFIKIVNPIQAIFIKYEFWPNYLLELNQAQIPSYAISAIFRPSQVFFKSYGSWYLNLLKTFNHIFVQDSDSLELLNKFGLKNASIAGDTRFDRVVDGILNAKTDSLVESFIEKAEKVIVAGSSWPKDEELLLRYVAENKRVKLILVPHEIHETHLNAIDNLNKSKCLRYTQTNENELKSASILVINTIGLLSSIYRYGHLAYIGGGFGVGIHNTLEAAVWNVPVVFGSNFQKFKEAKDLVNLGGGFNINNYEEFKSELDLLLEDKDNKAGIIAGNYVKNNTGATQIIINRLLIK
jgi:3-deoxy-D-manno-octulosonic-acid transferase